MRIFLAEPPDSIRYSDFAIPHFAMAYLAARLLAGGHEVRVFQATGQPRPEAVVLDEIRAFQPDLVGLSAPTHLVLAAAALAERIKTMAPRTTVLVGGWHVTGLPHETLREYPAFDYGMVGEAEDYILPLLELLARNGDPATVPGLVWRRDGEVVANPPGPPTDITALPRPAWQLLPLERSTPMYRSHGRDFPMMAGRGCPFQCVFCQRVTGARVRARDPEDVIDEMLAGAERWQCDGAQFFDETFTVSEQRTRALCERMIERGVPGRLGWNCTGRVDTIQRDLLALMKRAGCCVILLGLESGNQEVLDGACKGTTLQQGMDAVRWCREVGLRTDVSFVLGLPRDTRRTVRETLAHSRRVDPDFVSYFSFVPFPGTEGARLAAGGQHHLRLLHRDWSRYRPQMSPPCELQDMSAARLVAVRYWAYARFYLRPRKIRNLLNMLDLRGLPKVAAHVFGGLFRSRSSAS